MRRTMALSLSGLFLVCAAATAAPIPLGLTIQATVSFDLVNSVASQAGASQSGTLNRLVAGIASSSSFVDDPQLAVPSLLAGLLTQTGDGVGASMAQSGVRAEAQTQGLFADYQFNLSNASAYSYTLVFRGLFTNAVSASGADAFAYSDISVTDGINELLFSDHRVDTLNPGNNLIADSAGDSFSIVLNAGDSFSFSALQRQRGGVFAAGDYSASLDAFILLAEVRGGPVQGVPAPGSLLLSLIALGLLPLRRRR